MNPPLLEVILELQFDPVEMPQDRLQYFYRLNSNLLPETCAAETPYLACLQSVDQNDSMLIAPDQIEISSKRGISFPRLRSEWTQLLDPFLDIFSIRSLQRISLVYWNEIPLQDLRDFRDYLNITFEMPSPLKERFEFFRSEFIYKYPFGEIKVWLQPDWDDQFEAYCIQLNIESRHLGNLSREALLPKLQELHEGIKDVFRQILSVDYIRGLPQ